MLRSLQKSTVSAAADGSKRRKKGIATDAIQSERGLSSGLLDLLRLRVAQIHGCDSIVREQRKRLKAEGETDYRLGRLKDWRIQTIFTLREMAALNLAEALTHHPIDTVPSGTVHAASVFFDETEIICLTLVILEVNDRYYLGGYAQPVTDNRNSDESGIEKQGPL